MLYLWSKNGDFEKYDLPMQLCSGQRGHPTPKSNKKRIEIQEMDYQKALLVTLKFNRIHDEFLS